MTVVLSRSLARFDTRTKLLSARGGAAEHAARSVTLLGENEEHDVANMGHG